jgi:hypothetical protein
VGVQVLVAGEAGSVLERQVAGIAVTIGRVAPPGAVALGLHLLMAFLTEAGVDMTGLATIPVQLSVDAVGPGLEKPVMVPGWHIQVAGDAIVGHTVAIGAFPVRHPGQLTVAQVPGIGVIQVG